MKTTLWAGLFAAALSLAACGGSDGNYAPQNDLLQVTGSYVPVFLMASFAYLTALALIHLLVPRLEPARV